MRWDPAEAAFALERHAKGMPIGALAARLNKSVKDVEEFLAANTKPPQPDPVPKDTTVQPYAEEESLPPEVLKNPVQTMFLRACAHYNSMGRYVSELGVLVGSSLQASELSDFLKSNRVGPALADKIAELITSSHVVIPIPRKEPDTQTTNEPETKTDSPK